MPKLDRQSIDMILVDPPYGKTNCGWDSVFSLPRLEEMWNCIDNIIKPNAAIVIFGSQPFTTTLISSYKTIFKQALVWNKGKGSNPLLARKRIMQSHEDIIVFCNGKLPYNPQMRKGKPYKAPRTGGNRTNSITGSKDREGFRQKDNSGYRYPLSVLDFSIHCGSKLHPTQKSVELMEYLIKTYTDEGMTVLDFAMGSGTTGVACKNTNRKFIGIELEKKYFEIAKDRISKS
jgi:site-specific DNA-methyltransferase (adenine-specific)